MSSTFNVHVSLIHLIIVMCAESHIVVIRNKAIPEDTAMNVEAVLSDKGRSVITIDEGATVREAAGVLDGHGIGAVIVTDASARPVAVVSERDIVRELALNGEAVLNRPVGHIMTQAFITADLSDTLDELMVLMTDRRVRHLPVLKDGTLIGIVSIGDLVKAKISDVEAESDAIKGYILS